MKEHKPQFTAYDAAGLVLIASVLLILGGFCLFVWWVLS